MRRQGTHGHRPQALGYIVIGQFDPIVHGGLRVRLHDAQNFGFTLEPMRFEVGNAGAGIKGLVPQVAQHITVRGQDEFDVILLTRGSQFVQRGEVVVHVAVGRIHDGGAAVQDMVAAQEQPVFFQHQTQVIGCMAGRVHHAQRVRRIVALQHQQFAVIEFAIRRERAGRARCGGA